MIILRERIQNHLAVVKADFWWSIAWFSLSIYSLSFALSIAMTQIFLLVFIFVVFIAIRKEHPQKGIIYYLKEKFKKFPKLWYFHSPLVLWLVVTAFSALLGLAPGHSLVSLLKFSIYFLLPLCVFLLLLREKDGGESKVRNLLVLFIVSHGIAGLHTFVSASLGYEIRPGVPGPLTESGQLELLFPVIFILPSLFGRASYNRPYILSLLFLVCFWISLAWLVPFKIALPIALLVLIVAVINPAKKILVKRETIILICISLSLAALMLGLKRGPWFSIIVEIAILIVGFFGVRCLGALLLLLPLCFFSIVRDRVSSFSDHFFISGGRFDMWKLGLELIERFPLGLGFGNSDLIRMFDATLPIMHRHMHNNFLNIFLECGLLGGLALSIWIVRIVQMSWPIGKLLRTTSANFWPIIRCALVVSVIGWQLGGLVEYNFGDGEIRLFALVLLGIYLVSIHHSESIDLSGT